MATLRQDTGFGVDSATLPTGWTGSHSAGGSETVSATRIAFHTGTVGARADTSRVTLNDAAVNAATNLGAKVQFDFSNETPLQDVQFAIFLRAANDWANGASPSFYVRTTLDTAGNMTLSHRLASGTNVDIVLAATTIPSPVVAGSSTFGVIEANGSALQAKWWPNTIPEPFTGGPSNDGWALKATMTTDAVTGAGRFAARLLGANAAGVAGYLGMRNDLIYDLAAVSSGGGGSSGAFVKPVPRVRSRRRHR